MRQLTLVICLAALCACKPRPEPSPTAVMPAAVAPAAEAAIAWIDGRVEDAFAQAQDSGKPVMLYWGAKWCPPCNHLKATTFHDPGFVAKTRGFVPVQLDGDAPDAARWGEHFGIAGFPTLIILRADRTELMRVSGSDTDQFVAALDHASHATAPLDELIAQADATPQKLLPSQWAQLSMHQWWNDPKRNIGDSSWPARFERMGAACPDPALSRHFAFLALESRLCADEPGAALDAPAKKAGVALLQSVFTDPGEVPIVDVMFFGIGAIGLVADKSSPESKSLTQTLLVLMNRIEADESADDNIRLSAFNPILESVPEGAAHDAERAAIAQRVETRLAAALAHAQSPAARFPIIAYGSALLASAGKRPAAIALVKDELAQSVAPNYLMADLAEFAAESGDKDAALDWSRKAWEHTDGENSRLRFNLMYVTKLIELRPEDVAGVQSAVNAVLDETKAHPGLLRTAAGWYGRLGGSLSKWAGQHGGAQSASALAGFKTRMSPLCAQLPAGTESRRTCEAFPAAAQT